MHLLGGARLGPGTAVTRGRGGVGVGLVGAAWVVCACAAVLVAAGCAVEERVTRYQPFLANVAGAQTQTPGIGGKPTIAIDPAAGLSADKLVVDNPDGTKTLVCKSVQQLMIHIERTLDHDEDEVFLNQLLSRQTGEFLRSKGKEPAEYVEALKDSRRDLALFFGRLPLGEHSPTALFEQTGRREYVVRLTGAAANGVKFTRLWVVLEGGNYRLLWIS